jgi:hypothetical protein
MTSTSKTSSNRSRIQRQVSLMHIVPTFLYLSVGLHASNSCRNCGNTYVSYRSMYYPCYLGFGLNTSNLYIMLSLPSPVLTMGIG